MTLSACGANLFDGEAIGLLGVESALCARGIKRSESEIYGECVLDDLNVALAGATTIPLTRATDQLLVEWQADLARSQYSEGYNAPQWRLWSGFQRAPDPSSDVTVNRAHATVVHHE